MCWYNINLLDTGDLHNAVIDRDKKWALLNYHADSRWTRDLAEIILKNLII
jgi:hypothetical protein